MNYINKIQINCSRDKVVALFSDTTRYKEWQKKLLDYTTIEGHPGQTGAKSILKEKYGKKTMDMTEYIESNKLPDTYVVIYQAGKVWNRFASTFESQNENTTLWIAENEFRCKGIVRIVLWLMPGSFRRETERHMHAFKIFAEDIESQK